MNFKKYEENLVASIEEVIQRIIDDKHRPNIIGKTRVGAEVSDYLEDEFVKYISSGKSSSLYDAQGAPKEKTKNPWDARCKFKFMDREEEIWIDFKAFKITNMDSNPDIGTPNKIVKFIHEGNFYLVFVLVYYESKQDGVEFVKYNNDYKKVYLLKDVNESFRINPKPQMQVNIAAEPTYRTREEFIHFFVKKWKESFERQIKSLEKKK
ncbi:hypothetical protein [Staphylococcus aureus]|uniref:hypothetical protein n=1 Tax=Staphylococcus aureus TaxID=1280 RepID=UPI0015611053|nr:hypothetical protein [Staphylococcus aureus]